MILATICAVLDEIRQIRECRVCGAHDWLEVIDFGSIVPVDGLIPAAERQQARPSHPLEPVACRECWLVSLRHVVPTSDECGVDGCLAHVDDVHTALAERIAGGAVTVEVPHLLPIVEENRFDSVSHAHLSYFSLGTLAVLFARHGLRIVDVERTARGTIVVHGSATGTPTAAVGETLALEAAAGLGGERAYRDFALRSRRVIAELRLLVRNLATDGERIAGYGTPASGCTLLQLCGLGPEQLTYTTDPAADRQGRFTPGATVPVVSPEYARLRPPDYFLVLDWPRVDEIVALEQDFLHLGGQFIVPVPEPRIVWVDAVRDAA